MSKEKMLIVNEKSTKKNCLLVKQGSVLAYSLIIIAMMMSVATSLTVVTMIEKKSANSSEVSVQALQTADSGAQLALKKINDNLTKTLIFLYPSCVAGKATGLYTDSPINQEKYELSFYVDEDNNESTPVTIANCAAVANTVKSIKSMGTYKKTTRSVDVVVGLDGNDALVNLLLHANGTGGSFIDSSKTTPEIITTGGNATQSTTQFKFGTKSAYFDGAGDYLSVPYSTDFNFGSGDMTIDAWVFKSGSWSVNPVIPETIFAKWDQTGPPNPEGDYIFGVRNGKLAFFSYAVDSSTPVVISSANVPVNSWAHVAIVKKGSDYALYINGVRDGTATNNTAFKDVLGVKASVGMYMDAGGNFTQGAFSGYIDELRVSKGTARWVANFTPPVTEY